MILILFVIIFIISIILLIHIRNNLNNIYSNNKYKIYENNITNNENIKSFIKNTKNTTIMVLCSTNNKKYKDSYYKIFIDPICENIFEKDFIHISSYTVEFFKKFYNEKCLFNKLDAIIDDWYGYSHFGSTNNYEDNYTELYKTYDYYIFSNLMVSYNFLKQNGIIILSPHIFFVENIIDYIPKIMKLYKIKIINLENYSNDKWIKIWDNEMYRIAPITNNDFDIIQQIIYCDNSHLFSVFIKQLKIYNDILYKIENSEIIINDDLKHFSKWMSIKYSKYNNLSSKMNCKTLNNIINTKENIYLNNMFEENILQNNNIIETNIKTIIKINDIDFNYTKYSNLRTYYLSKFHGISYEYLSSIKSNWCKHMLCLIKK